MFFKIWCGFNLCVVIFYISRSIINELIFNKFMSESTNLLYYVLKIAICLDFCFNLLFCCSLIRKRKLCQFLWVLFNSMYLLLLFWNVIHLFYSQIFPPHPLLFCCDVFFIYFFYSFSIFCYKKKIRCYALMILKV